MKNKNQQGMNSTYRKFGCFYEKNIEKYLKSRETISWFCPDGSGTSSHPMFQTCAYHSTPVKNYDFKFEYPTLEEYCEWYSKKYGKEDL